MPLGCDVHPRAHARDSLQQSICSEKLGAVRRLWNSVCLDSEKWFLGPDGMPCVVLWREALDYGSGTFGAFGTKSMELFRGHNRRLTKSQIRSDSDQDAAIVSDS